MGGGGRVIEILRSLMGASGKFYHMTQPRIFPEEILVTTSTEIKNFDTLSTAEAAGTSKPK